MSRGAPKKNRPYKVTWAEAFRDIVTRAIDRGQLVTFGLLGLLWLLVVKLDNDDAAVIAGRIVDRMSDLSLVGYALTVAIALCWYIHAGRVRRRNAAEMSRMGNEKRKLQETATGKKLKTSDKKRYRGGGPKR